MSASVEIKHLNDDLSQGGTLEVPVKEGHRERVEAYLAGILGEPVKPKLAATVMLLRETPKSCGDPFEVFMMRRAATMKFVPDAVVFPGGGLDPKDADGSIEWTGPDVGMWANAMGCDVETARSIVTTAVRELFEECGVLLAGPADATTAVDTHGNEWIQERKRLENHELSFAQFLRNHNFVLRSELLSLCAHWVTPECEPRRYDTYFFVARLPEGQATDDITTEAIEAHWTSPRDILRRYTKQEVLLVPPTIANLSRLAHLGSLEEAFLLSPRKTVMLQALRKEDGQLVMRGEL